MGPHVSPGPVPSSCEDVEVQLSHLSLDQTPRALTTEKKNHLPYLGSLVSLAKIPEIHLNK